MNHPVWDLNVSKREFKKVLQKPDDDRFLFYFSRVLSRVPFREAFHQYITLHQFKKYFPQARRLMNADLLGAGRLSFWNWLYRKVNRKSC